ncbi:MAG: efflux RND transporter periplasmic adaptor subunit [Wenzhouxiangella sp.]
MNGFFRIGIVIVGLGLVVACGGQPEPPRSQDRDQQVLPVQAVEVRPRDLSRTIQVSAPVEPFRTIRLASRTEGVLTEVLVEAGDVVSAGEVLARIDVREQRAELTRSRARLNEKRTNFERMEQLKERDYIDAASYEAARAELEIARSEVELWETRVDFGIVSSTIDGTIVAREVEPGEAISRHAPLFSIADLSSLVMRIGVSELDIRGLRMGDAVVVQVDAVDRSNPIAGVIRRIFPAPEPVSRLITVEIELPDAGQAGVRPGFLARARLMVDQRENVLAVPAGSVAESEGEYFVMVINGEERLERRVIEPGVMRGAWREVQAGLEPGDRVVSANPLEMSAGDQVRIVEIIGQEVSSV